VSGRWIEANSPDMKTGRGFVPGTGAFKGDMVQHDCQPSGSGGTWTCSCGRSWKWSEGSGFFTWGESRKGKR
jgi:hypothetical protein